MRKLKILGAVGVAALLGLLVISASDPYPGPPTATFVCADPSGLVDDSGAELLLVTFTINNTNRFEAASNQVSNIIWVKDTVRPTEARVRNRWRAVPPASATNTTFSVGGARPKSQCMLLAPVGTDSCRVWLQYTRGRSSYPLTLKGISMSIVTKLPLSVRSRISYKFWRWAGFPDSGPDTKWREVCVELPISPSDTTKASAP